MRKWARLGAVITALLLVMSLVSVGVAAATDRLVDQRAEVELMPTMMAPMGTEGTTELSLRIDADGMLELFSAGLDAEGLLPDVTYSFFVGWTLIGSGMADANGSLSIDEEVTVDFTTLLGLKVRVVEGTSLYGTKVLVGKVTELERDVIPEVEEEEVEEEEIE